MDIKLLPNAVKGLIGKYKYALLILLLGIGLMCLPGKTNKTEDVVAIKKEEITVNQELADVLSCVDGAGEVKVFLTEAFGEETIYQTNSSVSADEQGSATQLDTVLVSGSQRDQAGLVKKVNPPVYQGAIIVCEGADNPSVRLAIVNAVSKVTGLGTDKISVLKMK